MTMPRHRHDRARGSPPFASHRSLHISVRGFPPQYRSPLFRHPYPAIHERIRSLSCTQRGRAKDKSSLPQPPRRKGSYASSSPKLLRIVIKPVVRSYVLRQAKDKRTFSSPLVLYHAISDFASILHVFPLFRRNQRNFVTKCIFRCFLAFYHGILASSVTNCANSSFRQEKTARQALLCASARIKNVKKQL